MKIHNPGHCLVCGRALSAPVFEAEDMPLGAQAIPTKKEIEKGMDRGIRLSLRVCPACGLVQFDCDPVAYYPKVIRAVGLSETMRELRRADYRLLIDRYGSGRGKWIECGCGNGDFLQVLTEFPVEIYATEVDPANAAAARAQLPVSAEHIMERFPYTGDEALPGAPFDVFLSFNFLEHQPDPVSMLCCMRKNLKNGGYGLITVPSFEYILEQGRYYELVRDHIANYDLHSLENLCRLCGFAVLESERIGIGDTLRVVVQKTSEKDVSDQQPDALCGIGLSGSENRVQKDIPGIQASTAADDPEYKKYRILWDNYQKIRDDMEELTGRLGAEGRTLALWGAGHQGFTIAATTALKDHAKYMIDSADFKQGKYAPSSHIPIVAPEHYLEDPVDAVMITAPGYAREIRAAIIAKYKDTPAGVPEILTL